jgi:hypothetical protein
MKLALPLDKTTTADKFHALEEIWVDLQRNVEDIPCPRWHADVLRARERRVEEGRARFAPWAAAKRRISSRSR